MRHTLSWAVLSFATALSAVPSRADDACPLSRIMNAQMDVDLFGGVYVPMSISGQTVNLLIDTGGVVSTLTQATVRKLGLTANHTEGEAFAMVGGTTLDRFVVAHDIAFGVLHTRDMSFLVMPDERIPAQLGGTLAPNILKAFDVDFDFASARFNLFSQNHCEGHVVYWTGDDEAQIPFEMGPSGHIELVATLDGRQIRATLDTGSSRSFMTLEDAERLFGFDETSPDLKPGREHGVHHPFKTMTFGGSTGSVTVSNPDIELMPRSDVAMPQTEPKLTIGMGVLRQLHLYIAYKERKLYVTAASAH